jgi:D-inositol-3-phosphate glycosyltransferase
MRKRIAMISEHASPLAALGGVDSGGQNVYVAHLARSLAAIGYRIDIFTRRDSRRLPEIIEWTDGIRIVHVPVGPPVFVRKENLLPYMADFTRHMLPACKRNRYALIHAHFWMSGLVAAEIKRHLGIPFVITFHALGLVRRKYQGDADEFPDDRFGIENRIIEDADQLIAECPQDEEDMIRLYNADPAKIATIPCGFDPLEFWPIEKGRARKILDLDPDERIILQLGRIVPRKGIDNVIRAYAKLRNNYGIRARLVIVGGESGKPDPAKNPEIARLQGIASEEGVSDGVLFSGQRSRKELKHFYGAADIFVTTPWYEPFGITPVEAMACGTPVVGSNVGGIKFTVRDSETGYLVAPNDSDALAERIAYLYQNPKLLNLLGRQSIRRANDLFTWERIANMMRSVYEEVMICGDEENNEATDLRAFLDSGFQSYAAAICQASTKVRPSILETAQAISDCLSEGGKVLVCGNGTNVTNASHFAGKLIGAFREPDRAGLPVLALNAHAAELKSWSEGLSYEDLFARQVEALGRTGDVLLGIGIHGRAPEMVRAFETARRRGLRCIAMLGMDGGDVNALTDVSIVVPSVDKQKVQEVQLVIIHLLCELLAAQWSSEKTPKKEQKQISGLKNCRSRRRDAGRAKGRSEREQEKAGIG